MKMYSWNIALHGKHVFQTREYEFRMADIIRAVMVAKFPATEGYTVDEISHDSIVYTSNRIGGK